MASIKYSARELVEMSIEWQTRKSPDKFLLYDPPASAIENLAMFDAKDTNLGGFDGIINPHLDLNVVLERADEEEERCKFLQSLLVTPFKSAAMKKEVNALLDTELKSLGLTDPAGPELEYSKKALKISQARVMSKLGLKTSNLSAKLKADFELLVTRLRGGFAHTRDQVSLYFNFDLQFWAFLEELQNASAISVIPPVNMKELAVVDAKEATMKDTDEEILASVLGGLFVKPVSGETKEPENTKPPGYTLKHGPWKWLNNSVKPKKWEDITDVSSFNNLILHLRTKPDKNDGVPSAVICHSLDLIAIKEHQAVDSEYRAAEFKFVETMRERGFDSEEIGGNFMDFWQQEREDEMNNWNEKEE